METQLKPMKEASKKCVACGELLKGRGPCCFSHYDAWNTPEQAPRFWCYECIPGYAKFLGQVEHLGQ